MKDLEQAAKTILSAWDDWNLSVSDDKEISERAKHVLAAACFAGLAYDDFMTTPILTDAAPINLLRAFMLAIIDPSNQDLDKYRLAAYGEANHD